MSPPRDESEIEPLLARVSPNVPSSASYTVDISTATRCCCSQNEQGNNVNSCSHINSSYQPFPSHLHQPNSNNSTNKSIDTHLDTEVKLEFGGDIGVSFMMTLFPLLMYYFWYCLEFNNGALAHPPSLDETGPWFRTVITDIAAAARPNWWAVMAYTAFVLLQAVLAVAMPGPVVKGLPVPSLGFQQLDYLCNGVACWYVTLAISAILHFTGVFCLSRIVDEFGPLLTVSVIAGIGVTLGMYLYGIVSKNTHRMSGHVLYDIFMGAVLNPRLGKLDLKIWSEIRVPWIMLFYVTVSCACKEYDTTGAVRPELWFMVLAHTLYANACMKGEECIPTTWDIFYEKWGFMLIFWNFSGVPFTYCYASLYLLRTETGRAVHHSVPFLVFNFSLLIVGYYIWDTANSQKNRFRMSQSGTYIPRRTFPQLPWGTIREPAYIRTEHGSLLLTSGWWGIARKIHYTADLMMALSWALNTGFGSVIPYFYPVFFLIVLAHRVTRDMERCKVKYGKDWEEYCDRVPWIFIPYVY
ncbi:ergosterol biosynthesis ERG4/ERG24 [Phlyctochytrium arcticum]|nr:ergosterol biosynthesis ERG4/ERG24 [Phlyctochytrium arcticum]